MFCTNCGKELKSKEKFCTNCGSKVENKITQETNSIDQEITTKTNEQSNDEKLQKDLNKQEIIKEKTKKKINKIPFIIAITVLVVILIGLLILKFIVFSPKNLFFKGINEVYSNISSKVNDMFDDEKENKYKDKTVSIKTSTTFKLNGNELYFDSSVKSLFDFLNEVEINMNEVIDNKTLDFDLNTSISNNEGKLNLDAYKRENSMYLKFVDIYDKYILQPFNAASESSDISKENLNYITKTIKDIFLKSLDNSKFEQNKDNLSIQGEDLEVNKISYRIDAKEAQRIMKKVVLEMKKDDKLIDLLSSNLNVSKEKLNEMLDNLYVDEFSTDVLTLNVYTKGFLNDIICYDISIKNENGSYKILFSNYKEVEQIRFSINGLNMISINKKEVSKDKYETEINALTLKAKINSLYSEEKTNIDFDLTDATSNVKLSGSINYTGDDKKQLDLSMKLNVSNEEIFDISAKTIYEISTDATLDNINTGNSIKINEISNTELEEILKKLQENKFVLSLTKLFANPISYDSYIPN